MRTVKQMNEVKYYLPDFYANLKPILFLADLSEKMPECFREGTRIAAVYGCFPGSIWNGGRVVLGSATRQEMEYVISELNGRGIALRYTFTNPLLEQYHMLDTYCNLCLQLADNGNNEVLVNSPVAEKYIREVYPGFKLISSTTKCLSDTDAIRAELEKDYALVVLDSSMNNTDALFSLPNKDKIELIANHYCADNCPNRVSHYRSIGKCQLEFSETDYPPCPNIQRDFWKIMENRSFLSTEMIYGSYRDAGFCNFKLDGRGFRASKVMESFLYYLIQPEWRDRVRSAMLKEIYKL